MHAIAIQLLSVTVYSLFHSNGVRVSHSPLSILKYTICPRAEGHSRRGGGGVTTCGSPSHALPGGGVAWRPRP